MGVKSKIKIISNWRTSIDPSSLNKLAKILMMPCNINSRYGEYQSLMLFLTNTGISLLDFIDLSQEEFDSSLEKFTQKQILYCLKKFLSK